MPTPLLWLLASASALGPRVQQRAPLPPPPAASPMPVRVATGATGAAWVALGARTFDVESSRQLVGAPGVATATFEDNIREPAAGFLELTSPVFVLEGVLLIALAANVFEARPADAARVGASLALASAATLAGLAVATASRAPVVDQGVVGDRAEHGWDRAEHPRLLPRHDLEPGHESARALRVPAVHRTTAQHRGTGRLLSSGSSSLQAQPRKG